MRVPWLFSRVLTRFIRLLAVASCCAEAKLDSSSQPDWIEHEYAGNQGMKEKSSPHGEN